MAHSEITVANDGTKAVGVMAYGGTRHQRGAAIAAYVRQHPELTLHHISHGESETPGSTPVTYARYTREES